MFTYEKIKEEKKLILAMTGLTREEFEKLVPIFEESWAGQVKKNYKEKEGRQREYGGGRGENLELIENKLLGCGSFRATEKIIKPHQKNEENGCAKTLD